MTDAPSPDTAVSDSIAPPRLQAADPADVAHSITFALRYQGRKRVDTASEAMARITAERLVEHLRQSGFVVMKGPPLPAHSAPGRPPPS